MAKSSFFPLKRQDKFSLNTPFKKTLDKSVNSFCKTSVSDMSIHFITRAFLFINHIW